MAPHGDPPCVTASVAVVIDALGTRGDIQGHCGASIGPIDGAVAGPFAVDGEPRISRNGGYDGYRAAQADEQAWTRCRRPKRCKLADSPQLRQAVARKLRLNWSPEQIAGWLKRAHPEDKSCRVSHETIYRSLFVKPAACLRKSCLAIFDQSERSADRSKRV